MDGMGGACPWRGAAPSRRRAIFWALLAYPSVSLLHLPAAGSRACQPTGAQLVCRSLTWRLLGTCRERRGTLSACARCAQSRTGWCAAARGCGWRGPPGGQARGGQAGGRAGAVLRQGATALYQTSIEAFSPNTQRVHALCCAEGARLGAYLYGCGEEPCAVPQPLQQVVCVLLILIHIKICGLQQQAMARARGAAQLGASTALGAALPGGFEGL